MSVEDDDESKRTNEITTATPLLDAIEIHGKDITADALLTQRAFASCLVDKRQAHDHFTVTGNQPHLLQDVALCCEGRQAPAFVEEATLGYGRLETRHKSGPPAPSTPT